jgi:type IV pilus assembly protein PilB
MNPELLAERLVSEGELTALQLELLRTDPLNRERPLAQALLENGLIEEEHLLQTMAEVYHMPALHLEESMLDRQTAGKLPEILLRNFCLYPLLHAPGVMLEPGEILVAVFDPFDVIGTDALELATHRKARRVLAKRGDIRSAIAGKLSEDRTGVQQILQKISGASDLEYVQKILEEVEPEQEEAEGESTTAPIVQLVNSIISDGIRMRASDIHFEPLVDRVRVRYRLDGILRAMVDLPKRVQKACTSRLKLISGIDIAEGRRPQDGRSRVRTKGREVDLRVSTLPTYHGEKVVLRILDRQAVTIELESLGLAHADFEVLTAYLRSSQGLILHTGPTGSGKTSSLYAALKLLNSEDVNIVTVEDPIEYQLDGINQVQVQPKTGLTFASSLRTILRQDPDIVMVGEIRDLETAEIALQAAQTGHLVLSTLHTNDAPSTFTRLVLMGLQPYMVVGSLLCIVAQRLVRRLCPSCRVKMKPSEQDLRFLKLAPEQVFPRVCYTAPGCPQCDHTGYKGRTGLFEILSTTESVKRLMLEGVSEHDLWREARREGMRTLLEDGIEKVERGVTSLGEVLRVVTLRRQGAPLEDTSTGRSRRPRTAS